MHILYTTYKYTTQYLIHILTEKSINIRLKESTHKRLLETGNMNDTFDTLINRILDENIELKKLKK